MNYEYKKVYRKFISNYQYTLRFVFRIQKGLEIFKANKSEFIINAVKSLKDMKKIKSIKTLTI